MSHSFGANRGGAGGNMPDWKGQHYLLVDDFQGMRQLLRESLRNLGARFVDQAGTGGEAITLLQQSKYDVVLCDYNLGEGKNGQQVLEEARVRELIQPTTVWIVVSAEKSVESVMGTAEHQPDAYLIKPITEEVLLSRLNRVWTKKQIFRGIDAAYNEKDYLRAAKLCDEQIEQFKAHALDLLRMKATLLLRCGEPEQAKLIYERILVQRDFTWATAGLAKIHMLKREYGEAKLLYRRILDENQFFIEAYDQLAVAYSNLGQFEDAVQILERGAKLSPNSVLRQRNLGEAAMRLGRTQLAEKAFRKSLQVGQYSVVKTPDAHLGLARICGMKNEPKEALELLTHVQREHNTPAIRLRSKITEGLVYHESGDYKRARKAGDELGDMLAVTRARPAPSVCLDMARLMFAVGVKEPPVDLLTEISKNNHDNEALLAEVQQVFDGANMSDAGAKIIADSRKESADMMNKGVLLWKTGKMAEAVEWMRNLRIQLPTNLRVLFNCAQIMISSMQKHGYDPDMAAEARDVLMTVDQISPGQQRFAQLMEMLTALSPGA
jgi:CheY-like chemotaxis protein/thioredoxin-like negative regulator of GroEL